MVADFLFLQNKMSIAMLFVAKWLSFLLWLSASQKSHLKGAIEMWLLYRPYGAGKNAVSITWHLYDPFCLEQNFAAFDCSLSGVIGSLQLQ